VYGQMRMYGYRTSAGPNETNWLFFQESRVIMMIAHECNAALEEYVLKTMDGKRQLLARVNVALSGVLARYWRAGALFGNTSSDAFYVDTDSPNTLETMAAGELYANVGVKTSKLAEWVVLNLVKYRTERPLPVAA
jgi:phage tail sheath protein FI